MTQARPLHYIRSTPYVYALAGALGPSIVSLNTNKPPPPQAAVCVCVCLLLQ